jgi:hypothetical protein
MSKESIFYKFIGTVILTEQKRFRLMEIFQILGNFRACLPAYCYITLPPPPHAAGQNKAEPSLLSTTHLRLDISHVRYELYVCMYTQVSVSNATCDLTQSKHDQERYIFFIDVGKGG